MLCYQTPVSRILWECVERRLHTYVAVVAGGANETGCNSWREKCIIYAPV